MKKIIEISFETNRENYEVDKESAINDFFGWCNSRIEGTEVIKFMDRDYAIYSGNTVNNYYVYTYLLFNSSDITTPENLIKVSRNATLN